MNKAVQYTPRKAVSDADLLDAQIMSIKHSVEQAVENSCGEAAADYIGLLFKAMIKREHASSEEEPIKITDLDWYRLDDAFDDDGFVKTIDHQDMGQIAFLWPGMEYHSGGVVCAQDVRESFSNEDFSDIVQSLKFDPNRTRPTFPMYMHQICTSGWLLIYLRNTDRWHVVSECEG